jgi:UPF0755 protein
MPKLFGFLKPKSISSQVGGLVHHKKPSVKKILLIIFGIIFSLIIGVAVGAIVWFNVQLTPLDKTSSQLVKVTIAPGSTSSQIGQQLEEQSIIRSATAFNVYIRLMHEKDTLQAGAYRLSSSESVDQIIEHFLLGTVDQFSITFFPGATLVDNSDTSDDKKYDVTSVLSKAGYTDQEIAKALVKSYYGPLFEGRPRTADLEGYIYGETYKFNTGATVEDILTASFAEFELFVEENNLVQAFADHGLSLYEGITLASIVQREASTPADQQQVAQVFYSRLAIGMQLGSDVTYQYIADKTGVARDPGLDSPYNTRRYTGLPPGPIAVPGSSALLAVANPAEGDYLYFLAGDDGATYFARSLAEHEANIVDHCAVNCSTM